MGVVIDSRLSLGEHVASVSRSGYYQLRQLRPVVRCLSEDATKTLVQASVRRRSRRTFSTHFQIFRRRVDGVVVYFFNSDFKFFDGASKFSVCSFDVVFIFS